MKTLFLFLLMVPLFGLSQTTETNASRYTETSRINPFYASLEERYVDFCKADSNKITVGYEFILTDRKKNTGSYMSMSCYNPRYRAMFVDVDPRMIQFVDGAYFNDPKLVWEAYKQQYKERNGTELKNKYYEVASLKMSPIPTFEGFVQWKKQFIQ